MLTDKVLTRGIKLACAIIFLSLAGAASREFRVNAQSSGCVGLVTNCIDYEYDDHGRLVQVRYIKDGTDPVVYSYQYDKAGNRTLVAVNRQAGPQVMIGSEYGLEGTTFAIPVYLSELSPVDVTVYWETEPGTAAPTSDYTQLSGSTVIPAQTLIGSIPIDLPTDGQKEGDETFTLKLTDAAGAHVVLGDHDSGLMIIRDSDVVQFEVADVAVTEGLYAALQLQKVGETDETLTVQLNQLPSTLVSQGLPATLGVDFMNVIYLATGTDTYSELPNNNAFVVPQLMNGVLYAKTLQENVFEQDEQFSVYLSWVTDKTSSFPGYRSTNRVDVRIENDDPEPMLWIEDAEVAAGEDMPFQVNLTNPTYLPVTVTLNVSDTTASESTTHPATQGAADYDVAGAYLGAEDFSSLRINGNTISYTLPGDMGLESFMLNIPTVADEIGAETEAFYVGVQAVSNASPDPRGGGYGVIQGSVGDVLHAPVAYDDHLGQFEVQVDDQGDVLPFDLTAYLETGGELLENDEDPDADQSDNLSFFDVEKVSGPGGAGGGDAIISSDRQSINIDLFFCGSYIYRYRAVDVDGNVSNYANVSFHTYVRSQIPCKKQVNPEGVSVRDAGTSNEGNGTEQKTLEFGLRLYEPAPVGGVTVTWELLASSTATLNEDFTVPTYTAYIDEGFDRGQIVIPLIADSISEPSETVRIRLTGSSGMALNPESENITATGKILNDDNYVPTLVGASAHTVEENSDSSEFNRYYTLQDVDDEELSLTLAGPDRDKFTFVPDPEVYPYQGVNNLGGTLHLKPGLVLDHENLGDANGDGIFEIALVGSDGPGGHTETFPIEISIADVEEDPVFTQGPQTVHVDEAMPTSAVLAQYIAVDPEGTIMTYAISETSVDGGEFNLDSATGELRFVPLPDFEAPTDANSDNRYNIIVEATDGTGSTITRDVEIIVQNINEAPSASYYQFETGKNIWNSGTHGAWVSLPGLVDLATDPDIGDVLSIDPASLTTPISGYPSITAANLRVVGNTIEAYVTQCGWYRIVYKIQDDEGATSAAAYVDFNATSTHSPCPINGASPSSPTSPPEASLGNAETVNEGNSGNSTLLRFPVILSPAASEYGATVGWVIAGGSAQRGTDYQSNASGTLTFTSGVSDAYIEIPVSGDVIPESDETVRVKLTSTGTVNVGNLGTNTASGTIANDDIWPELNIWLQQAKKDEGGVFDVTIEWVSGVPSASYDQKVFLSTQDVTATAGADYEGIGKWITIPAFQRKATLTVQSFDDNVCAEGEHTFNLNLGSATPPVIYRNQSKVVTLRDNDNCIPVAVDDFTSAKIRETIVYDVIAGSDTDGDLDDVLEVITFSERNAHLTVSIVDGTKLSFSSASCGLKKVDYTIRDRDGATASATLTVDVTADPVSGCVME